MTVPFFTPDKSVAPVSLRAIELWQLTHEGVQIVNTAQLSTAGPRGRLVYNIDTGLFYMYNGTAWQVLQGQMVRLVSGHAPYINVKTTNSGSSADAGHDVITGVAANIPVIDNTFNKFKLEASVYGFVYAVDPGANAVFNLQITDNSNVVLVEGSSTFITGSAGAQAGGITVIGYVDNSVLTAGSFTMKLRVASSNVTQAYATIATATRPTTFTVSVV